jgi:hypothetical protein
MFFLTFLILPVAIMSGFSFLESIVEGELAPERHNLDRKPDSQLTRFVFRLQVYKDWACKQSFYEVGHESPGSKYERHLQRNLVRGLSTIWPP